MDLRDFVALFVTETQEHRRLLDRALLALEQEEGSESVDEAFRAAHTLKGLSATMGFRAAADQAHALEDRLHRVRTGELKADAAELDALLAAADALGAAIDHAVATEEPRVDGWDEPPATVAGPGGAAAASPAAPIAPGELAVRVTLRADAPVKAARAMLVVRAVEQRWRLARTEPATFDDAFAGEFRLVIPADAERDAVEAAIRAAGEVDSVAFEDAASAAQPLATAERVRPAEAPRVVQVRVDQRRLDEIADGIGELSLLERRLHQELAKSGNGGDAVARMATLLSDLQHAVLSVRMVPIGEALERFPRVVRDAARRAEKEIEFRVEGEGIEIDRSILDDVVEPLLHLLRNAVDHGIEPAAERIAAGKPERGTIVLRATRGRASVRLTLEDDGRGVNRERVLAKARDAGLDVDAATRSDDELFRLMAHPGLSTTEQVSELSGRGVGLDAVVARVRALGGAIDMTTRAGAGTTFMLRLPITLALARALLVRVDGEDYAVPLTHISEAVELEGVIERSAQGGETVRLREDVVPLVRMGRVLGTRHARGERAAVVAELGQRRTALGVDEIVGHEQILVKTFDAATGTLPIFSGATLLADGRPALVLDPLSVI